MGCEGRQWGMRGRPLCGLSCRSDFATTTLRFAADVFHGSNSNSLTDLCFSDATHSARRAGVDLCHLFLAKVNSFCFGLLDPVNGSARNRSGCWT